MDIRLIFPAIAIISIIVVALAHKPWKPFPRRVFEVSNSLVKVRVTWEYMGFFKPSKEKLDSIDSSLRTSAQSTLATYDGPLEDVAAEIFEQLPKPNHVFRRVDIVELKKSVPPDDMLIIGR